MRRHIAVPEDQNVVGDLEHLVQAVADIDNSHPLIAKAADKAEEAVYFLGAQGSGGLVQDEKLPLGDERAGDFHDLAFCHP